MEYFGEEKGWGMLLRRFSKKRWAILAKRISLKNFHNSAVQKRSVQRVSERERLILYIQCTCPTATKQNLDEIMAMQRGEGRGGRYANRGCTPKFRTNLNFLVGQLSTDQRFFDIVDMSVGSDYKLTALYSLCIQYM